jgi:ABC-2 type transport system permease protein
MSLLKSEWIKLWTTRTTWVMIGVGLMIEALFAGLYVGLVSLSDIGDVEEVATGTGMLLVLMLVLGVLVITTEFRHGTASSTFLVSPKRYPVLAAKFGIALLVGALAGIAFFAVNGGLALPLLNGREGRLPPTGDIASIYVGVAVSMALICAFGFGVGAIVRNQVGAIIAAIAFFFILSPLPELLPGDIGDYFPAQAIGSLHGLDEANADGLGQIAGGLVLAAWATGLSLIGGLLICRRDVSE